MIIWLAGLIVLALLVTACGKTQAPTKTPNITNLAKNQAGYTDITVEQLAEMMKDKHISHMEKLRDIMIKNTLLIEDSWLNGPEKNRLCNNAHFSFRFIEGESLIVHLDLKGISASTGSACSSKSLEPSHVLMAIGLKPEEAHGSVRFSLGRDNTKEEVEKASGDLREAVETLRKISPLK